MSAQSLFPQRADRAVLEDVIERFPFPLAITYDWQGTRDLPPKPPHRHEPWGPPRPMTLRHKRDRGVPVLAYLNQPGAAGDYRSFVIELADRAHERHHLNKTQ
jgi:hypothetical protein